MADIELVVKMPEEIRLALINNIQLSIDQQSICDSYIKQAIINGTPLPKGHGKLIAEPTEEDIAKTIGGQNDFAECIRDAVQAVIDNAKPVTEQEIVKPYLEKLRAEIKALSPKPTAFDVVDGNPIKDAVWETIADVLKIIDKYKAEGEG